MKKINNNNGITLIALVVTIIVLLILAGVTLVALTGNNGLIEKANDAKISTELAGEREQLEMDIYNSHNKRGNLEITKLKERLGDKAGTETEFPLSVTYSGGAHAIVFDDGEYIDYFDIETGLGDVYPINDPDGTIDENDINTMIKFYFGDINLDLEKAKIDANNDGIFTGTDIISIYELAFQKNGRDSFLKVLGDVDLDGKINEADILYIQYYLGGDPEYTLDSNQEYRADVYDNDKIDIGDTLNLQMLINNQKKYNTTVLIGDVNFDGKVDEKDINMMIEFLLKQKNPSTIQKARMDYNNDKIFDGTDLIGIYENAYAQNGKSAFTKVKGDVNLDGKIDSDDVDRIMKYAARDKNALENSQMERADFNSDGEVDVEDAAWMQRTIYNTASIQL